MTTWSGTLSNWLSGLWAMRTRSTAITGGSVPTEPVVVWRAANWLEAQVLKGRLESEGIPVLLRGEALGPLYGLTTGGLAEVDLLVPGPLAERAREILTDLEEDPEASEDRETDTETGRSAR